MLRRVALKLEHPPYGLNFSLGPVRARQRVASAEHGPLHIISEDGAVAAEVFTYRLDLLGDPHQELEIGFEVRRSTVTVAPWRAW